MKLYHDKTYVIDGNRIASPAEAALLGANAEKGTMTYSVLSAHNKASGMDNLDIRFDSMGVYDNTYVGILQSARASGLKEFPIPCIFTNCHNCLCAVGGTVNADLHKYALSACQKFGGIFVPPHQAVIHQYMREMVAASGGMSIVSDSHTRYGALGSLSIGEGGPELVKTMLNRGYALKYPKVVGVLLTGKLNPWAGPMDIALTIIGGVFKEGFVKNAVLEFIGEGVLGLSMDTRNGVDTMTTESACLSSIWITDGKTKAYFAAHGREEAFREMRPAHVASYDRLIELDLSTVEPMIALPFHPSNAYTLAEVIKNPGDAMAEVEKNARKVFENNPNVHCDMRSKIVNGKIIADQGVVAGCCAGSFENIYVMGKMAERFNRGVGAFGLNVYPASQPVLYELNRVGALNALMNYGVRVKTAFCGPCFGAGDTPANNDFSIRHTTRNFPNREGSNPTAGQIASVALMDARSIAATAFAGGALTSAADCWEDVAVPEYRFNGSIYKNVVYNGFGRPQPEVEVICGPDIKDWPPMPALTENLLLRVAGVIRDEVTTTDELIPSGEAASYRSNPYKISQYTLLRKDPKYVGRATAAQAFEQARLAGDKEKAGEFYAVLKSAGVTEPVESLLKTTGIGSVLYAKRPGDGSAREYAASCQKVLGGLANICIEYATKRYRSNCVNWGILPFTCPDENIGLETDEYLYLPGIRQAVLRGDAAIHAIVIGKDASTRVLPLLLPEVTAEERDVLLSGSLINYYRV